MSAYAIRDKNSGAVLARVEATNRREALTYGRTLVEAVELTTREIVAAEKDGKVIVDVNGKAIVEVGGESQE